MIGNIGIVVIFMAIHPIKLSLQLAAVSTYMTWLIQSLARQFSMLVGGDWLHILS